MFTIIFILGATNNLFHIGWSTFTKSAHRRASIGGALRSRGYSLRDCESACMKDIPCLAIDYVPWLRECWIYHQVSPLSELQKDVNVDHYRPARCSTSKGNMSPLYNAPRESVITRSLVPLDFSAARGNIMLK